MKTHKVFLIFFTLCTFLSCTKEERVINSAPESWKYLVATETAPFSLTLYEQPSGDILVNDVFSANNAEALSGKVEKIAEYGKYLFLFIPSKNKIEVITNDSYKKQATLDFTSSGKIPTGICFANGTDSYVTFGNDSTVQLVDLTNFQPKWIIPVGHKPVSIACPTGTANGNQIYVTNAEDNTVSVIDSRDHAVAATIKVSNVPFYVDFSNDGLYAAVVSLGTGKADSNTTKSAATVTIINVNTKAIVKTQNLGTSAADAINQIPRGLSITDRSWGFIPTKTNLFRINSKTGDISNLGKNEYLSAIYNYKRDELIVLRKKGTNNEIYTADPISAAFKSSINSQFIYQLLFPLSN